MSLNQNTLAVFVEAGIEPFAHQPFAGEKEWIDGQIAERTAQHAELVAKEATLAKELKEANAALANFRNASGLRAYDSNGTALGAELHSLEEKLAEAERRIVTARAALDEARERGDGLAQYGQQVADANQRAHEVKRSIARQEKRIKAYVVDGFLDGMDLSVPLQHRIENLQYDIPTLQDRIAEEAKALASLNAWRAKSGEAEISEADAAFTDFVAAAFKLDKLASNQPALNKTLDKLMLVSGQIPLMDSLVGADEY